MDWFFFILLVFFVKHRFYWKARKISKKNEDKKVFFSHRGKTTVFPENTLNAFLDAVNSGYEAVEVDLVRTKDNELVCSHNLDLETETNGFGYFKNYTLDELKDIKTGINSHPEKQQTITDFKTLLGAVPDGIYLNIELKTEKWFDLKPAVILNRYRKEGLLKRKYIVSTFNPFVVFYIRFFTGLKRIAFLVMYRDWLWLINWIHPDALHPSAELLDRNLINCCKRKNLTINTWTVNNFAAIKSCLNFDIDGIITDTDKPLLIKDLKL